MRLVLTFLSKVLSRKISRCDNYLARYTRDTDVSLQSHLWRSAETTGRSFFTRGFFFCAISLWRDLKIYTTSRIYAKIVRFNAIWHRRSVAALVLCWGLTESDVTVTPSVTCVGWLRWCYNHVADVVPLQQHWLLVPKWVRNVNQHHLVQSKWKIGERQSVLIRRNNATWKGERIVDIWRNVRFVHTGLRTISDSGPG